ncbi:Mov34/MPN/PAD-1 family protein [Candidatus Woesearchaeota archaeon]|nr:Mov34/MPN/PAD-1 family protein [Candidatus Woesearchaeota archaeon]
MASVFKNWIKKFLGLDRFEFERVVVKQEVIDNICSFAKENHPREFIMFLEGKAKDKVLRIRSLAFQEYAANEDSASPKIYFPLNTDIAGSIHSHPGPSNRPSRADRHFFSKNGMFHMIIKEPYEQSDIQAYDKNGQPMSYEIED